MGHLSCYGTTSVLQVDATAWVRDTSVQKQDGTPPPVQKWDASITDSPPTNRSISRTFWPCSWPAAGSQQARHQVSSRPWTARRRRGDRRITHGSGRLSHRLALLQALTVASFRYRVLADERDQRKRRKARRAKRVAGLARLAAVRTKPWRYPHQHREFARPNIKPS